MPSAHQPRAHHRAPAALVLIAVFGASALAELGRIVTGNPWPTATAMHSHVVSGVLTVLWTAAAIGVGFRRRTALSARTAWLLAVFGTMAMVPHALMTRVLGSWYGVVYLGVAVLNIVLIKKAFDRGVLPQPGADGRHTRTVLPDDQERRAGEVPVGWRAPP